MKYRKKPIVIEALQFKVGMDSEEMCKFCPDFNYSCGDGEAMIAMSIETLEGEMEVSDGDFVIKGIKGEFYPCKPDIFAASYEVVE